MMDEIWMSIDEYAQLTRLDPSAIDDLIARDKLTTKTENGRIYIDPSKGTQSVVPIEFQDVSNGSEMIVGPQFVEKTIGTIINLHEKVLGAKDETIEAIKNENLFLKEALSSLQELYEEDRKTIDTLTTQLQLSQKEVEFMRRKYKLMWGKVVEEYGEK
jgi:hypothetical protein